MPEDRFGDLGADAPEHEQPSAAERFAELDETDPEPKPKRPEPPRPSGRYTWVVGVAALVVIVIGGIKVAGHGTGTSLKGPPVGQVVPAFAAPSATGTIDGDANVKQSTKDSQSAGKRLACDTHGAGIVNICDLRRQKPLVLTFIVTRGANCNPQLDRVQKATGKYPGVQFVGVVSGDQRSKVAKLVKDHGWRFPVAVDRDGAIVNLYRVGVCPTTVFARAGGRVRETKLGNLDDRELDAAVRAIER